MQESRAITRKSASNLALAFILLGLALAVNAVLTWLQHAGEAYER